VRRRKVQVWVYREGSSAGPFVVLLLRLRAERGGFWQPVTGGVEAGEGLDVAALREAEEETGFAFQSKPEPLDYRFRFFSERYKVEFEEHVFALHAPEQGEVRLDPHEHLESKWVAPEQALAELKHPSNAEGLRRLMARKAKAF
jgi:8-oxo-dGTP pyrophosphatase MutT (NUDIX family)